MENLRLALFQFDLYWEDAAANLARFEEELWAMEAQADIIILPEMFTTGFSMNTLRLAEPMNLHSSKWMLQMAAQMGSVITGSVMIKDGGKYFNRLLWATPDGQLLHYDKRHLFRMAEEDHHYDMGQSNQVFEYKGWKIRPQVCYDLRFPVWSRNRASGGGEMDYDLIFYVASWPAPRVSAWDILLQARAVENLAYCIGVNRIGEDGNGVTYSGHSAAYDFKGKCLNSGGEKERVILVDLDKAALKAYREKFPAWKDADRFEVK
ncbi:Carbon-nitrogen hydrolase [Cyclobacterium lianum]|uniref:Omega-amidase YafV n=1 Tax=Cyclobacterium lianum TaxID=388280 RepID=A0A1M7JKS6_9BACT|nr:amidohydrolase [Cyclobacterium lianum]SHM53107.1 Carbon-nitrogen hydrolase [Cyclobacterium lianum]